MHVKQIIMADGSIRRFNYRDPMTIAVVDPEVDRGRPPRDIKLRDIVWARVKRNGEFPLRDMLNLRSVEALWVANNRAEEAAKVRSATKRAPAKAYRA